MDNFIPLSVPYFNGNEKKYVEEAIETAWVSTGGQMIVDFEKYVSKYTDCHCTVAVQSGTAGLHLACLEVGITSGDEVIVPALTFIAAVNPVIYCGAVPVFMDCDSSLCMDMKKLESFCIEECFFTDGKLVNKHTKRHIKAVVAVHIFGNMCDMENLMRIAAMYNLKVIEDATEALGSYITSGIYKNRFAGTVGDIGVFSFNGNKIITTGGGGMVVTSNEKYAKHIKYLSTQAKDDDVYFIHSEIGYNYRMTNLQAALGLAQIEQLKKFISIKEKNYKRYSDLGLNLIPFSNNVRPNYWFYSLLSKDRDGLIKYLSEKKIQARPIWKLIYTLKPYKDYQSYKIQKAVEYYKSVVNIPCSSNLTFDDIDYVVDMINEYEKNS